MDEFPNTRLTLLNRVTNNDSEAEYELYSIYRERIYRYCLRKIKNKDDIEDIISQTFETAFKKIKINHFDHPGDRPRFRYWLMKIAHNKILTLQRDSAKKHGGIAAMLEEASAKRHNNRELLPDIFFQEDDDEEETFFAPDEERQLQLDELGKVLKIKAKKYSPNTWLSFYYTFMEGKKAKEVAAELGIPENTVRKYKSRVLEGIRECLQNVEQIPTPKLPAPKNGNTTD